MVARIPQLQHPIPRSQVQAELGEVWAAAGLPGGFRVAWPAYMDRRHRKNRRSYAEVRPDGSPVLFAFADALRRLPAPNRWGLYAHEVGHVLDPDGSEDEADAAARHTLGVRIGYDHRWPGKGLQSGGPVRRMNPEGCDSGIQFDDGFCSPRGELDSQPDDYWTKGCAAAVALAIGQELGDVTAADIAREMPCSLSSARRYLRELEELGAVRAWDETRGLDKTGRRIYQVSEAGMDLAEWIKYRQSTYGVAEEAGDDPLGLESYLGDPGIDPWDWTQDQEWTFSVQVEPPADPTFDPWRFLAWTSDNPDYPIGELVMFESGHAVYDTRQFGAVGPEDYAPVGRMRIHPAYRQSGVSTALLERAAAEAEKLGVSLSSDDARTPGQAAWWTAQVGAGRARKVRHRSRKHPEASRYVLSYPPPGSLALKGPTGKGKAKRKARLVEGDTPEAEVPFNNPPYGEWWRAELENPRPRKLSATQRRMLDTIARDGKSDPPWGYSTAGIDASGWHRTAAALEQRGLVHILRGYGGGFSAVAVQGPQRPGVLENPCWPCLLAL